MIAGGTGRNWKFESIMTKEIEKIRNVRQHTFPYLFGDNQYGNGAQQVGICFVLSLLTYITFGNFRYLPAVKVVRNMEVRM